MKKMKPQTFLTLIALLLTGFVHAQKLTLKKDQSFTVTTKANIQVNQEVMGQTMEMNTDSEDEKQLKVTEVNGSSYKIKGKSTKLKTKMSAMGQEMEFDSDNPDKGDANFAEPMKKNMEAEISFDVDAATGNVTMPESMDENSADGMMAAMGSDPSMQYEMLFMPLPASKLKAGATWTDSTNEDGVKMHNTYTVKEIKGSDAVINRKSVVDLTKSVEAQQGMQVDVSMKMNVDTDGTYDAKTGLLKKATINMTGEGSADAMGMNIPMTLTSKTEVSVK